ncbi:hypothetical protein HDU76_003967, partial [Blyttiomyces sp. JEL0837]
MSSSCIVPDSESDNDSVCSDREELEGSASTPSNALTSIITHDDSSVVGPITLTPGASTSTTSSSSNHQASEQEDDVAVMDLRGEAGYQAALRHIYRRGKGQHGGWKYHLYITFVLRSMVDQDYQAKSKGKKGLSFTQQQLHPYGFPENHTHAFLNQGAMTWVPYLLRRCNLIRRDEFVLNGNWNLFKTSYWIDKTTEVVNNMVQLYVKVLNITSIPRISFGQQMLDFFRTISTFLKKQSPDLSVGVEDWKKQFWECNRKGNLAALKREHRNDWERQIVLMTGRNVFAEAQAVAESKSLSSSVPPSEGVGTEGLVNGGVGENKNELSLASQSQTSLAVVSVGTGSSSLVDGNVDKQTHETVLRVTSGSVDVQESGGSSSYSHVLAQLETPKVLSNSQESILVSKPKRPLESTEEGSSSSDTKSNDLEIRQRKRLRTSSPVTDILDVRSQSADDTLAEHRNNFKSFRQQAKDVLAEIFSLRKGDQLRGNDVDAGDAVSTASSGSDSGEASYSPTVNSPSGDQGLARDMAVAVADVYQRISSLPESSRSVEESDETRESGSDGVTSVSPLKDTLTTSATSAPSTTSAMAFDRSLEDVNEEGRDDDNVSIVSSCVSAFSDIQYGDNDAVAGQTCGEGDDGLPSYLSVVGELEEVDSLKEEQACVESERLEESNDGGVVDGEEEERLTDGELLEEEEKVRLVCEGEECLIDGESVEEEKACLEEKNDVGVIDGEREECLRDGESLEAGLLSDIGVVNGAGEECLADGKGDFEECEVDAGHGISETDASNVDAIMQGSESEDENADSGVRLTEVDNASFAEAAKAVDETVESEDENADGVVGLTEMENVSVAEAENAVDKVVEGHMDVGKEENVMSGDGTGNVDRKTIESERKVKCDADLVVEVVGGVPMECDEHIPSSFNHVEKHFDTPSDKGVVSGHGVVSGDEFPEEELNTDIMLDTEIDTGQTTPLEKHDAHCLDPIDEDNDLVQFESKATEGYYEALEHIHVNRESKKASWEYYVYVLYVLRWWVALFLIASFFKSATFVLCVFFQLSYLQFPIPPYISVLDSEFRFRSVNDPGLTFVQDQLVYYGLAKETIHEMFNLGITSLPVLILRGDIINETDRCSDSVNSLTKAYWIRKAHIIVNALLNFYCIVMDLDYQRIQRLEFDFGVFQALLSIVAILEETCVDQSVSLWDLKKFIWRNKSPALEEAFKNEHGDLWESKMADLVRAAYEVDEVSDEESVSDDDESVELASDAVDITNEDVEMMDVLPTLVSATEEETGQEESDPRCQGTYPLPLVIPSSDELRDYEDYE